MTVKKASDLPAADHNGLSDPYVKMTLDEKKKKTHIQKRTLNPIWNEKHEWMHVRTFAPPSGHLIPQSYVIIQIGTKHMLHRRCSLYCNEDFRACSYDDMPLRCRLSISDTEHSAYPSAVTPVGAGGGAVRGGSVGQR